VVTRKRLAEQLVAIDREIEAYGSALDANDAAEATRPPEDHDRGGTGGGDIAGKMATLMARRAKAEADLGRLDESGETQLSRTDADARLLSKSGQTDGGI
jgi:hypothetical protein